MTDVSMENLVHGGWERRHAYGRRVHILDNLYLLTALARLSGKEVRHPEMTSILRSIYEALLVSVVGQEFPRVRAEVPTRMEDLHPAEGIFRGAVLDPQTQVVIVDVVRAGIVPAQTCFEMLCSVLPPDNVRLDHLSMSRVSARPTPCGGSARYPRTRGSPKARASSAGPHAGRRTRPCEPDERRDRPS